MSELRVGVIGVGRMGARHVTTYMRMDETRLVAVADMSAASRKRALGQHEVDEYDDWRRMLDAAAGSLDAVSIACPSEMHAEVALAALDCGLHVLCEKPLATTLPDALRLRTAARDARRKLMVGHIERFNPAVIKLRELVAAGRLGRVYRVQGTRVGPLPDWMMNAGVALDLATHDVDAMQYVLGRDLERVFADGGSFIHTTHEDLITCLMQFGDGILGLLDVNWLTPERKREMVLLGEAGMLRADYVTQDVWFVESSRPTQGWDELAFFRGDAEGSALRFGLRRVEPLRAELEAFVRCILDDTPEPVDAHDGVRAVAAALAIRDSAASGRAVRLLEIPAPPPMARRAVAT